jgi:predicted ester cyclase
MSQTQLEQNKEAVRRYMEAFNHEDLDTIRRLTSPEMFEKSEQALKWVHATFSDHSLHSQEIIAENDTVVVRILSNGRHTGEFRGVPATGRSWEGNEGVSIFRFANGLIVDLWWLFDVPLHLQKLGITMTLSA